MLRVVNECCTNSLFLADAEGQCKRMGGMNDVKCNTMTLRQTSSCNTVTISFCHKLQNFDLPHALPVGTHLH